MYNISVRTEKETTVFYYNVEGFEFTQHGLFIYQTSFRIIPFSVGRIVEVCIVNGDEKIIITLAGKQS